jgi:hypothetical protein
MKIRDFEVGPVCMYSLGAEPKNVAKQSQRVSP